MTHTANTNQTSAVAHWPYDLDHTFAPCAAGTPWPIGVDASTREEVLVPLGGNIIIAGDGAASGKSVTTSGLFAHVARMEGVDTVAWDNGCGPIGPCADQWASNATVEQMLDWTEAQIAQRSLIEQSELRPLWIFSCQLGYRPDHHMTRLQEVLAACPSANIHLVLVANMATHTATTLAAAPEDICVMLNRPWGRQPQPAVLAVGGEERSVRPYYAFNGWYDIVDARFQARGRGRELVLPPVERRDVRRVAAAAPSTGERPDGAAENVPTNAPVSPPLRRALRSIKVACAAAVAACVVSVVMHLVAVSILDILSER